MATVKEMYIFNYDVILQLAYQFFYFIIIYHSQRWLCALNLYFVIVFGLHIIGYACTFKQRRRAPSVPTWNLSKLSSVKCAEQIGKWPMGLSLHDYCVNKLDAHWSPLLPKGLKWIDIPTLQLAKNKKMGLCNLSVILIK